MSKIILTDLGIVSPLGHGKSANWQRLFNAPLGDDQHPPCMVQENHWLTNGTAMLGKVSDNPDYHQLSAGYSDATGFGRCALLAQLAYKQISQSVSHAITQFGRARIAVVIGTSTSGTAEAETSFDNLNKIGQLPQNYHYDKQQMSAPAQFIADLAGTQGPVMAISTACSSGAKALVSGANLISSGVVDAVIAGGADSLCRLTINGFNALESLSEQLCNPMSENRQGINIGEGAALFLMQKGQQGIELSGFGESSDAHHMSAPHPEGDGAFAAMNQALAMANLTVDQLNYINLHGTATVKNDQMEARAVARVGAAQIPASSTKPFTGHTLAGAGAIEAGLCWLAMSKYNQNNQLPPHYFDGHYDQQIPEIALVSPEQPSNKQDSVEHCLSNSFAFGGSNVSLILSRNSLDADKKGI